MPGIEGGSRGFGGGRSGGMARGGGVGLASRASVGPSLSGPRLGGAETRFSSKGLAAFRSGSERPSLNLGSTDTKPTLNFSGTKFSSEKVYTPKTPGVRSVDNFKGNTLFNSPRSAIRSELQSDTRLRNYSRPSDSPIPRVESSQRANGIEVKAIIPNTKPDAIVPQKTSEKNVVARSQGLVTRANLDRAVPFVVGGTNTNSKEIPQSLPRATVQSEAPKVDLVKKTESIKPVEKTTTVVRRVVFPTVPKPQIAETKPTVELRPSAPIPTVEPQIVTQQVETVAVKTAALSELAALQVTKNTDEEEQRKEKAREAETMQRIAGRYVRVGLARDQGEGMRMLQRFLQIKPDVLAASPQLAETVVVTQATEQPVGIASPQTETQTKLDAKVALKAKVAGAVERSAQVQMKAKRRTLKRSIQTAKEFMSLVYKKTKDGDEDEERVPMTKYVFKLDSPKEKNRLRQWRQAILNVFPYMDPEYRVPLKTIVANMEGSNEETQSTLIRQVGKKVDGSDIEWRKALDSDTEVTKGEAWFAGAIEIYTKPPVIIDEKDVDKQVKENDVRRVLRGDELSDEDVASFTSSLSS